MPLGVTVLNRTAPPSRGVPTDTGTLFVPGTMEARGSLTAAVLCRSVADFVAEYGTREERGNAVTYDYLDAYFREGGNKAYVARYATERLAAGLALFLADLGPGQVVAPQETPSATTYGLLADHAAENNRVALLDVANRDNVAAMRVLGERVPTRNDTYAALFGPWVSIPAPAGVVGGSSREVPASAVIAALCNRVDRLGNPNRAAAGRDFAYQYATDFMVSISASDREALLNEGVNTGARIFGLLQNYGFQTTIAQTNDSPFWQFNCARARMWLTAHAQEIGEGFMFKPIDGRGRLAGALKRALAGICLDLYEVDGLYGNTPEEAFAVEVGVSVNEEETVAQGQLNAVVEARLSMHAREIIIELVSVPVTGNVSSEA